MESTIEDKPRKRHLPLRQQFGYSVGHVLNDLCASMWFTYLLVYFHLVLEFENSLAGLLLLIGQIADGLATPFVGFESDRNDNFFLCRYGKRKTWHLVGAICVLGSFPFLFMKCVGCDKASDGAQSVYYAAFIVVFQFGWASMQISHLSLIPDLTRVSSERVKLNSLRYAFTVMSNVCVYGIAWAYLGMDSGDSKSHQVGPDDAFRFQNIMFCVIGIGFLFSIIFHLLVKENPEDSVDAVINYSSCSFDTNGSFEATVHLKWKDWFKEAQFYKIALLYMATRLYVNLSQVYFPLYLQDTLDLNRQSIAIVPLVIYLSGFVTSFIVNAANKRIGHKIMYLVSALIGVGTSFFIFFAQGDDYRFKYVYIAAALVGVGGTAMLITSLAVTSDLIGHNTSSGAFVFGAMSLVDKLSNGIAVMAIQYFHPCTACCVQCKWYYADILSIGCGSAAVLALIALALLAPYPLEASIKTIFIQSDQVQDQQYGVSRKYITNGTIADESSPLLINT